MTPLDRRGFGLATQGCLLTGIPVGVHFARDTGWTGWLRRVLGDFDHTTAGVLCWVLAGALVLGLWGWFVARQYLVLFLNRWQAALPLVVWIVAGLVMAMAYDRYDPFGVDAGDPWAISGDPGGGTDGQPDDPAARVERLRNDWRVRQYLAMAGLALAALAVIAAAWCAARGLRRDPIPVAQHFD